MAKRDYSIFLISNKPERYSVIQENLLPELLYYFDGSKVKNFSELVNQCTEACLTEIVILVGDKCRPKQEHIQKIVELLEKGYGLVGLYRFGFFGFKKELFRKIGMFDERYAYGGYDDYDFIARLILSDIAFYVTQEVEYFEGSTAWDYDKSVSHFLEKWKHHWDQGISDDTPAFEKTMVEEKYNYDLGPSVPIKFLPCRRYTHIEGDIARTQLLPFYATKLYSSVPLEYVNNIRDYSYSIFLISNKSEKYSKIQENLLPELLYFFDASNAKTFSKLVNSCVEASQTETVILLTDNVFPKQEHIGKLLSLLDRGYGFVSLYRFKMFGFKKEVLRRIGMFDERFLGRDEEGYDFLLRLIMEDIAIYVTEEVEYHKSSSDWDSSLSRSHWNNKWDTNEWQVGHDGDDLFYEKRLEEEQYTYDLGISTPTIFLPCRQCSFVNGTSHEILMIANYFKARLSNISNSLST